MSEVPCHIRKSAVQAWLNELTSQVQTMRDRATAGMTAMNDCTGYCLSDLPDPANCCDRSVSASADAQRYSDGFDSSVADHTEESQTRISNIDCANNELWRHQVESAENRVDEFATYLASKDQELGTLEAIWGRIGDDCPIPIPPA
jgi:hypothetical protein